MAVKPILIYGHPTLRVKSLDVGEGYDIKKLIKDLRDTLATTENGVGLSANQIDVPLRAFIGANNEAFINWTIIEEKGGYERRKEGCLSIPKIYSFVKRAKKIKVHYFDENWNEHTKTIKHWDARIFMHEADHCEGKMFIDMVDQADRMKIQYALDMLLENKVPEAVSYKFECSDVDPAIKAKKYA